ncbi:generic peroxidase [Chlorociboria aeruginascens]|nr:generic peroxidase [Chlorociboria aeruginascens]
MLLPVLLALFTQIQGLNGQVDANGITLDEKILAMERQILQPFTLVSVVTPCSVNFNDNPERGEQTSAEWVRIVFHDSITANIEGPGLGGIDASIGFESDRTENIGIFINVTLGQFSQFSSVFLSMSDLIGVGLSDALATCDPDTRRLPLRVGRIDATGPGPAGVPTPSDSLDFATAAFATAGFSQAEMIQAVACGHSLGGVHRTNFESIVDGDPSQTPSGTDGRDSFDSTPAIFDNSGVNEYLNGTGTQGGPLVVGPDETNSDLRIFTSDGNVTINAMSSAQSFEDTCFTIFEKMINTVPAAVTLSDPIGPRPWILRESHLDLDSTGVVTYSGTITSSGTNSPPANAAYFYETAAGVSTGSKTSQAGVPFTIPIGFGIITDYVFSDTSIDPTVTSINVENSFVEPINQNIFILVSQSFNNQIRNSFGNATVNQQFVIRAAILQTLAPPGTELTAKLWFPVPQANTVVPAIASTTQSMTAKGPLGSYTVYQAVVEVGDGVTPLPGGTSIFQVSLGTTETRGDDRELNEDC